MQGNSDNDRAGRAPDLHLKTHRFIIAFETADVDAIGRIHELSQGGQRFKIAQLVYENRCKHQALLVVLSSF